MTDPQARLDRRSLLQMMGALGATTTVISSCGTRSDASVLGQPLTGSEFNKTVTLATAGPGGDKNWQPGYALQFLPPEEIATRGKASDVLAALPKPKLLEFYRLMATSRKWETTMKDLFVGGKDGLYGAFHTYIGEEAMAVGSIGALNGDDYIASTHRGHGHLIAKGGDLNRMSAEIFFKDSGYNRGYGGSMHITDMSKGIMGANGIVGASFYLAAGAALHGLVKGTRQVSIAFFGDGGAASPYYFSAIRSCANLNLPVIFVNENNFQYMSLPVASTVPTKYISDYTKGLGIPHYLVDGNDLSAVYAATKEAVDWARAGKGPSMIEGITYRWYDHSGFAGAKVGVDGAFGIPYRTDEEVRGWMARDPIARYRRWLLSKELATSGELTGIEKEVQAAVDASIEFARKGQDPNPDGGVLHTQSSGPVLASQFYDRSGLVSA